MLSQLKLSYIKPVERNLKPEKREELWIVVNYFQIVFNEMNDKS